MTESGEKCSYRWSAANRTGPRCCLSSGHEGGHLYKCSSPNCTGLIYPASVMPHNCAHPTSSNPDRVEWPDWLSSEQQAALRGLEFTASLACDKAQPDRLRSAGRRLRLSLNALRRSTVSIKRPPELPWPEMVSDKTVSALEKIELNAAVHGLEIGSKGSLALSNMRQLRLELTELASAFVEVEEELFEVES